MSGFGILARLVLVFTLAIVLPPTGHAALDSLEVAEEQPEQAAELTDESYEVFEDTDSTSSSDLNESAENVIAADQPVVEAEPTAEASAIVPPIHEEGPAVEDAAENMEEESAEDLPISEVSEY
jgi:hypothetical protein